MNQRSVKDDGATASPGASGEVSLGLGWSLDIERRTRGVGLRLVHPEQQPVLVEITVTANGPLIRAYAAALEIEAADDIVARCNTFSIEARDAVSVRAREIVHQASQQVRMEGAAIDLVAQRGDIRMQANDDVQLLGEQVLLNCEREPALPAWIPAGPPETTLPRQDEGGAVEIFDRHDAK